ncbi:hypothetical protein PILCRDRAFT_829682 [Piloderma croceum F 1598]|uniref:Uncharacterized protein n=1 Tax=Piloderma croceum (strain F 1598) TaxID=765440 RepID=A0A0C3EXW1_PILCF|nr:hypothetical protein PILCRDRAFT_829682 [Piloderma croceum F 1598]
MSIWGDYIVVVRPYDVQLFTRPSSSPRLVRTFEFGRFVWEAVIIDGSAQKTSLEDIFPRNRGDADNNVISFLITHEVDVFLYVLESNFSLFSLSPHENLSMRLAKTYGLTHGWMHPAWRLCVGITGHRMTWISGGERKSIDPPVLLFSAFNRVGPSLFNGDDSGPLLEVEIDIGDTERFPALWAFSQLDFDEALGVLAVGNVFGELAVCDYVGRWLDELLLLAEDVATTDVVAESSSSLPRAPVPMDTSTIIHRLPDGNLPDRATLSKLYASWNTVAETGVRIPAHWSNDWSNLGPKHMLRWQGTPGDRAWLLEHAFHFLGRPELILYKDPCDGNEVLFRTGGIHLMLGDDGEDDVHVYSDELTLPDILGHTSMIWPNKVRDISWAAEREWGQFEMLLHGEARTKGRNRWIEQKERGGSPPEPYLTVPQIEDDSFLLRSLTPESNAGDTEEVPV